MNPPVWLVEFHRQWHAARSKRVTTSKRAFSRSWEKLLDDAEVITAEDRATATREIESLELSEHLVLRRHRYRKYLIERVTLPPTGETWLRELFGGTPGAELLQASLVVVAEFSEQSHGRFPNEWKALCDSLRIAFSAGRSLRPFSWTRPNALRQLLDVLFHLSDRDWPAGTLIRAASVSIGLDSKFLERRQRSIESALARLLGAPVALKSLGLAPGDAHVELHGPICLHFPDGRSHDYGDLREPLISAADLARCTAVSTTADRILSIENRKTTFRQYAAANHDRRTLIIATSFPSPALRTLLDRLPPELPHYHFGDTDPAGWHILLKLREACARQVIPFQMNWRPAAKPNPLTPYDRQLLPRLIASPLLADVRAEIESASAQKDRGDFEQETLAPPPPGGWPFEK